LIKTEDYSDKNKTYSENSQTQIRARFARLIMGKRIKIPERMPGERKIRPTKNISAPASLYRAIRHFSGNRYGFKPIYPLLAERNEKFGCSFSRRNWSVCRHLILRGTCI
jgi:hypothetical protein